MFKKRGAGTVALPPPRETLREEWLAGGRQISTLSNHHPTHTARCPQTLQREQRERRSLCAAVRCVGRGRNDKNNLLNTITKQHTELNSHN